MEYDVIPLTGADRSDWDTFVLESGDATFCHQTGWIRAVEEIYGHRSRSLLARDGEGRIAGVLPLCQVDRSLFGRSLVSVPFAPYGGPCTADPPARAALIGGAVNAARALRARLLELRSLSGEPLPGFSSTSGYSTFLLDLEEGTERVWNGMSRKVRNRIRNARRHDLTCIVGQDTDAVRDFHAVYLRNQGDLGTPAHSLAFFDCLRHLLPGQVFILRVLEGDETIASLFNLGFRDTLTVAWGASLPERLPISPNNLAYWEILRFAGEKGFRFLDLGRSMRGSGNYRFKQHWNGTEIPLHYHRYPAAGAAEPVPQERYRTWSRVWRRLPLPVTRVLGPRIRRYIV